MGYHKSGRLYKERRGLRERGGEKGETQQQQGDACDEKDPQKRSMKNSDQKTIAVSLGKGGPEAVLRRNVAASPKALKGKRKKTTG